MKLIIDTRGSYLSKSGDCFKLKAGDKKEQYSARNIEQIIISTAVSLTSDAIKLAVDNNIDILFLDYFGQPIGRVWYSKLGSLSTIRRKQLELKNNEMGVKFVVNWISEKLDNQIAHLKKLSKNRNENNKEIVGLTIKKILKEKIKIESLVYKSNNVDDIRATMQGYEGCAGKAYFKALSELIPYQYKFKGRSKNPSEDMFNCMLNYGYGIMYSNVERACMLSSLDPYIGIMHTDNYNRMALTFDLIERYRMYIDEIVFKLFSKNKINEEHFDTNNGFYLNKKGKEILLEEYNILMEKSIKRNGKNIMIKNIIQSDCHIIANSLLKVVQ